MPFVSIRISGSATRAQKAGIVADVTRSLAERLGKNPAAVQIVIDEVSTENYGAGGLLIVDRDAAPAPAPLPATKSAGVEPELALDAPESGVAETGEDADAAPTR